LAHGPRPARHPQPTRPTACSACLPEVRGLPPHGRGSASHPIKSDGHTRILPHIYQAVSAGTLTLAHFAPSPASLLPPPVSSGGGKKRCAPVAGAHQGGGSAGLPFSFLSLLSLAARRENASRAHAPSWELAGDGGAPLPSPQPPYTSDDQETQQ
jgi:hypothetical protein